MRRSLMVALCVVLGGPAAGLEDVAPGVRDLAVFEGDWSQVDPVVDHATRMGAIDRAVGGLSWVVRQMAAPMLRKTTAPPPRILFLWNGEDLEQRVIEPAGVRSRPVVFETKQSPSTDNRGEPMTASWSWTDSGLELHWTQKQAYGSNVYRVDPASGALIVEHTIQVTAISDVEPIVFESRFGRQRPAAVSVGRARVESAPVR